VATQIASGVAQAARVADLETLALRDPLTGLGNRRVLDAKLRQVFARPAIARQDTAVIICDVDGLKEINDQLGHATGDAVLLEMADALRLAVLGLADATVCRIGGDEFCIIIDGGGQLLAEPVAERAQRLFARAESRSMSCGVAIATLDVHTPGDLLRAADEAQYEQKRVRRPDLIPPEVVPARPRRRARRDR
jgi:diguanylate cyclase (GGDEF)-like protein